MELQILNHQNGVHETPQEAVATVVTNPTDNGKSFIEANTISMNLSEIKHKHILPVFSKDNTPLISQVDFIENTRDLVEELSNRNSTFPSIRVSHPIKGRVFEARNKKASELLESEKTIYYERMAWISEIPAITENVNGQSLTMCFGGIKAYNLDNLNTKYGSAQHFKFFIGFKVKVCTNLCIWTDGFSHDVKVRSLEELYTAIYDIVNKYNYSRHLELLSKFSDYELSEREFATILGRARMYNHLPKELKKDVPNLLITDSQISSMTREYYKDDSFRRNPDGSINLWNVYNLLTGSIKSSYIDTFLDKNANAFTFTKGIADALDGNDEYAWFLN